MVCLLSRVLLSLAAAFLFFSNPLRAAVPPEPGDSHDPLTVVSLPEIIYRPAHLFNLHGKMLRFVPIRGGGGYRIQTLLTAKLAPTPHPLTGSDAIAAATGGKRNLNFPFPFGGKVWTELYVNQSGSLSFGRPEGDVWAERNPWAAGGMRSVAAALDERSTAGQEALIAPLWAVYDPRPDRGSVSVGEEKDHFAVTWDVQRVPWGHEVEGRNVFQARLYPSGVVELVYSRVPRQDGIVGLFPGTSLRGRRLDHAKAGTAPPSPSGEQPVSVDVFDAGSSLRFVFTLDRDASQVLRQGDVTFTVTVNHGGNLLRGWLGSDNGKIWCYAETDAEPRTLGYRVEGNTLSLFVSKTRLTRPAALTWAAHVTRVTSGKKVVTAVVPQKKPRALRLPKEGRDESMLTGRHRRGQEKGPGSVFEVFHYAWAAKEPLTALRALYRRLPPDDDIAVVFTGFRIDDLFAQGPSTGALNLPIQGIGARQSSPGSTKEIGFPRLQVAPTVVWVGAPFFAERGWDEQGTAYFRFARGVAWLAHEISHRWGPELRFRNPLTGKEETLSTPSPHWLTDLYSPAVVSLPTTFLSSPPLALSLMSEGGSKQWRQNPDGTFQYRRYHWWTGIGYSALDLYVMGLIPPEQVPETFLMQDVKPVSSEAKPQPDGWSAPVTAKKVPVRMQDILAVMGPRIPDAAHSQKEFRLGVYLIHEPGRPVSPFLRDRATRISYALADFFQRATEGRMKIIFTGGDKQRR